ncbi:MAG TPA: fumarylacetoacetate hydrolase family protein [Bryobacteraceae bacterium]|nr:fumarylacetoacetate hydrolase family protein [Bryobacteraceae bacterium]
MKFVTFRKAGGDPQAGVLVEDQVLGLAQAGYPSMLDVLAGGPGARAKIESWVKSSGAPVPLSSVTLLAPVPRPPKLICVGLNYRDHAIESKMEIPKVPTIFSKFPSAVIAAGQRIVLPKNSAQPDYEAEFAFVIGRGGRHIPAERWQEHVFGYTVINDVSARDFQMATSQWLMGKTFDTFAPMGPHIVSADEIPDPHALDISLTINGEVLQHSNTRELIFKIPELVAFLSSVFTLEPGDVVSTGTPAGVGVARKPPRFLRPGDDVVVRVERIGELRNPVVAES